MDHSADTAADADDRQLLTGVVAGDADALIELFRRHRPDIYRFAWAMSRSAQLAEDATQDTFLNLIEHASRFDPTRGTVRGWLFGCARHRVLDGLRRLPVDAEAPDVPGEAEETLQALDHSARVTALHLAITALPPVYREVLVLCDLQEMAYAEVAAVLDCPVGTVRSRLARARQRLGTLLRGDTSGSVSIIGMQPQVNPS